MSLSSALTNLAFCSTKSDLIRQFSVNFISSPDFQNCPPTLHIDFSIPPTISHLFSARFVLQSWLQSSLFTKHGKKQGNKKKCKSLQLPKKKPGALIIEGYLTLHTGGTWGRRGIKNSPRMSQKSPCINHRCRYVCVCTYAENKYVCIFIRI